jgi:alanine dehydrogenase
MALLLTENDVRALLPMKLALEAVEECFVRQAKGDVAIEPRRRIEFAERAFLHSMAAADRAGGYFGAKLYATGRGPARFLVLLYSAETSHLLALIEGEALGQLRTGAASGVATKHLARADARTLGLIGTGYQARTQLEAVASVRRLESVRVNGRDPERRSAFAREMSAKLGLAIEAVESAEQAVRGADIVITATSSARPVLEGKWLAEGAHVNAMGANWAHKREIDDEAVRRAALIAVDFIPAAKLEAGDLIQAFADEPARWESVRELAAIVAGRAAGRTSAKEITLFKSVGIAAWDVAVAARVYERAVAEKRGVQTPLWQQGE